MDEEKPYKAIIHVATYIYEVEPTGEVGRHIPLITREKLGIKNKTIQIMGVSLEDCASKVKEKIDEIGKLQ